MYDVYPSAGGASGGGAGLVVLAGDLAGTGSVFTAPRVGRITGETLGGTQIALVRNGASLGFVAADANAGIAQTIGDIRFRAGRTLLAGRNNLDTADLGLVSLFAGSDRLVVGGDNALGNAPVTTTINATTTAQIAIAATSIVDVVAASVTINGGLPLRFANGAAGLPGTGLIRIPNNVLGIAIRNAANSADLQVFSSDVGNNMYFGLWSQAAATEIGGGAVNLRHTGGQYSLVATASTAAFRVAVTLQNAGGSGTAAAAGDIRGITASARTVLAVDAVGAGDIAIIALSAADEVFLGGTSTGGSLAAAVEIVPGILRLGNGATAPTFTKGNGAPASAPPDGSVYLRLDGTAATTLYVRAAGAWTALT
jgi:hypothetical protein